MGWEEIQKQKKDRLRRIVCRSPETSWIEPLKTSSTEDNKGASGGSDVSMTSSDVAAAVSVPKPGKDRLTTSGK